PFQATFRTLGLARTGIDAAGVAALAASPRCAGLRALDLSENRLAGPEALRTLARSPHPAGLRKLALARGGLGDAGAARLAASPHLADLAELVLFRNHLTEEGLAALLWSPSLRGVKKLWGRFRCTCSSLEDTFVTRFGRKPW